MHSPPPPQSGRALFANVAFMCLDCMHWSLFKVSKNLKILKKFPGLTDFDVCAADNCRR